MYSIDGVPLKNSTYGWRVKRDGSNPFAPISRALVDFNTSGRDGTVQVRGFTATPTITLVITTPLANLDDLKQLLRLGVALTLTADSSKRVGIELVSAVPEPLVLAGVGVYRVTAVFRLPSVYWRDANTSDQSAAITSSGQQVTVFSPSTGPVRDALVTVGGSITGLQVAGQQGTYFAFAPNIPSGTWLTFDATSGRAWTGSGAYSQAIEVTGSIANGKGPYFLEFTGTSDPAKVGSAMTITYTSASGASIGVRGRNAYDL